MTNPLTALRTWLRQATCRHERRFIGYGLTKYTYNNAGKITGTQWPMLFSNECTKCGKHFTKG